MNTSSRGWGIELSLIPPPKMGQNPSIKVVRLLCHTVLVARSQRWLRIAHSHILLPFKQRIKPKTTVECNDKAQYANNWRISLQKRRSGDQVTSFASYVRQACDHYVLDRGRNFIRTQPACSERQKRHDKTFSTEKSYFSDYFSMLSIDDNNSGVFVIPNACPSDVKALSTAFHLVC